MQPLGNNCLEFLNKIIEPTDLNRVEKESVT